MRKMIVLLVLALLATAGSNLMMAQSKAYLYVVHGINGIDLSLPSELPVDVQVNGSICALTNFQFRQVEGPIMLDPGVYDFDVKLRDMMAGNCGGGTAVSASGVTLMAGMTYIAVAHLDATGAPKISAFALDAKTRANGVARVLAHHTAWAPAVDITLERESDPGAPRVELMGVSNGQQGGGDIRPGDWYLTISASGAPNVKVVDNAMVSFEPFKAYLVLAVGSLQNSTFELLTKVVDLPRKPMK